MRIVDIIMSHSSSQWEYMYVITLMEGEGGAKSAWTDFSVS